MILYNLAPIFHVHVMSTIGALIKHDKRDMQISASSEKDAVSRKYTIGIYVKDTAEGDRIQAFVDGMLYSSPY